MHKQNYISKVASISTTSKVQLPNPFSPSSQINKLHVWKAI